MGHFTLPNEWLDVYLSVTTACKEIKNTPCWCKSNKAGMQEARLAGCSDGWPLFWLFIEKPGIATSEIVRRELAGLLLGGPDGGLELEASSWGREVAWVVAERWGKLLECSLKCLGS